MDKLSLYSSKLSNIGVWKSPASVKIRFSIWVYLSYSLLFIHNTPNKNLANRCCEWAESARFCDVLVLPCLIKSKVKKTFKRICVNQELNEVAASIVKVMTNQSLLLVRNLSKIPYGLPTLRIIDLSPNQLFISILDSRIVQLFFDIKLSFLKNAIYNLLRGRILVFVFFVSPLPHAAHQVVESKLFNV